MRKFHPLAVQVINEGKTIYRLNIGQPDLPTPRAFYDDIRNFEQSTLGYEASPDAAFYETPDKGIDEVRIAYVRNQ
jgi:aspartate aminotransferase